MPQINLLPWREEAKKAKKRQFYAVLSASFFGAIMCVIILHFYYNGKIAYQKKRNNFLQTEASNEQTELSALDEKRKEKLAVEDELHFIMSLRESSYHSVELLDELVRIVPQGIILKKIIREGDLVTLIGNSASNLQVTLLMKNISKTNIFYNPDLTEITGKENTSGEERLFQLKFNMKTAVSAEPLAMAKQVWLVGSET